MTTAVRGPSYPLTLPGEKSDVSESGLPNGKSLDTPRSASMDATESGSDSEQQLASLASPQNDGSSSAGAFASNNSETSTTASSTPSAQPSHDQQQLFLAMQQQQGRQTGGYQGPPRPPRRALFPSQQLGPQGEEQKLPIRPEAEECLFYIHTGWCGYGASCRYNHPPEKMALHKPKAYNSLGLPMYSA